MRSDESIGGLLALASRGAESERERWHLVAQRSFLALAVVANPLFGIVRAVAEAPGYDSLPARFALSALCAGLLAGSFRWAPVRRRLGDAAVALTGLMFAWYAFSAARNGHGADAVPGLFVLMTAGVAVSPRVGVAALYAGVGLVTVASSYGGLNEPGLSLLRLTALLALNALSVGLFVHYREHLERSLEAERARLEARVEERTAQLQNEVQERRRAEAEAMRASEAKTAFLANLSHEVRTPLNAIIGYTAMVQEDLRHSEQAEDLRKANEAATHLAELLEDVLDIARIEAGSLPLNLEPVRLRTLVGNCLDTVESEATAKNLGLFSDVHPGVVVLADPMRVRQVVQNLVANAVRFTETGGIHLDAQQRGPLVALHVHDTGCGIAPEKLERAFQRFEHADPGRSHGGTGLGLAIARDLARLMGGDLTARSEPGRGSTFTLLMPAYSAPERTFADLGPDRRVSIH